MTRAAHDPNASRNYRGLDPGAWPWDRGKRQWSHPRVRERVLAWLVDNDLITSAKQRDLASAIVDSHFLRACAMWSLNNTAPGDLPMVGKRDSFMVLRDANAQLRQLSHAIGVRPFTKVEDDGKDADGLDMAMFDSPV